MNYIEKISEITLARVTGQVLYGLTEDELYPTYQAMVKSWDSDDYDGFDGIHVRTEFDGLSWRQILDCIEDKAALAFSDIKTVLASHSEDWDVGFDQILKGQSGINNEDIAKIMLLISDAGLTK